MNWSESHDGASGLCFQRLPWIYSVSPGPGNLLGVIQRFSTSISPLLEPLTDRGDLYWRQSNFLHLGASLHWRVSSNKIDVVPGELCEKLLREAQAMLTELFSKPEEAHAWQMSEVQPFCVLFPHSTSLTLLIQRLPTHSHPSGSSGD